MSERLPLLAANWKMHKNLTAMQVFVEDFLHLTGPVSGKEVLICPPFTLLHPLRQLLGSEDIALGGQNLWTEAEGAFTGEISGEMLIDSGCTYVIVGHSERRRLLGETDALIARKVQAANAAALVPVLCVGESLNERQAEQAFAVVNSQLEQALSKFPENGDLVIAYEPVWAIGTGLTAETEDAQAMCAFIRTRLAEILNEAGAAQTRILYGGSVKAANINELMSQADIDGVLVGGASLDAYEFSQIVRFEHE